MPRGAYLLGSLERFYLVVSLAIFGSAVQMRVVTGTVEDLDEGFAIYGADGYV